MYPIQNQSECVPSAPQRPLQIPFLAQSNARATALAPTCPRPREGSTDPNKLRKHRRSRRAEIPPLRPRLLLALPRADTGAQEWWARPTKPAESLNTSPHFTPHKMKFAEVPYPAPSDFP